MFELKSKFLKYKKQEPNETTVTHMMVEQPNTIFMLETSKVVQLLLDQDRNIRKSMTTDQELKTVKQYLERPNRSDFYDALELEKRLEFKKRFDKAFIPTIPEEKVELVKKNLKKEHQETQEAHAGFVSSAEDIQKQIDALEHQKNEQLTKAKEAEKYIGMGEALHKYLENPEDSLWSTPMYDMGLGQYRFGVNGLLHLINIHSQGKLQFITDYNKQYYQKVYELRPTEKYKRYQLVKVGGNQ